MFEILIISFQDYTRNLIIAGSEIILPTCLFLEFKEVADFGQTTKISRVEKVVCLLITLGT